MVTNKHQLQQKDQQQYHEKKQFTDIISEQLLDIGLFVVTI